MVSSDNKEKPNRWSKPVFWLSLLLSMTILCGSLFAYIFGMEYYPVYFPVIPGFFMLCGIILYGIIIYSEKNGKKISFKKLMAIRIARVFGSIAILLIGILLDKPHMMSYVIVFVIYYLVYLLFETQVMSDLNKKKSIDKV